ncbi:hypothetical protein CDAR_479481 [Caerostris darwini]|uniref:BTB domain-containing protein n=1 Tax=Caerostris darwini TaxID=1538125 RepID=A0AAV4MRS0_9ARAC|nr:hypothetical protein CDAR_479481 [Caerostris darwini]
MADLFESHFEFFWKIYNFLDPVERFCIVHTSPEFELGCQHVIQCYISLNLYYEEGGHRVTFHFDTFGNLELEDFVIKLQMRLVNGDGLSDSAWNRYDFAFPTRVEAEREKLFLQGRAAFAEFLQGNELLLHCRIAAHTDPEHLSRHNFNSVLQTLSRDMQLLRSEKSLRESVMVVQNQQFSVHRSVLLARWPKFCDYLDYLCAAEERRALLPAVIPSERLIAAAAQVSQLPAEARDQKVLEMTGLFTPDVADCLLHYVYSGQLRDMNPANKSKLIRVGRFFGFKKMIQKFHETTLASVGSSFRTSENYCVEWRREDATRWLENPAVPKHQVIELHTEKCFCQISFAIADSDKKYAIFTAEFLSDVPTNSGGGFSVLGSPFSSYYDGAMEEGVLRIPLDYLQRDLTFQVELVYSHRSNLRLNVFIFSPAEVEPKPGLLSYSKDFQHLLKDGATSDVHLMVGRGTIKAHRYILCARSARFRRDMAEELRKKCDTFRHYVNTAGYHPLKELLFFMYTGQLRKEYFHDETILNPCHDLWKAAFCYERRDLCDLLYTFFKKVGFRKITHDNL